MKTLILGIKWILNAIIGVFTGTDIFKEKTITYNLRNKIAAVGFLLMFFVIASLIIGLR